MGYTAVIGNQGSGKSTLLTMLAGQEARRLGKIAANLDLSFTPLGTLDWKRMPKGYRGPFDPAGVDFFRFSNDVRNLTIAQLQGRHIFFDDLTALFDSHYWELVPPEIRLFFATHRHYGCFITYSTPLWSRVDIDLRKNTDRILHVRRSKGSRWLRVVQFNVLPDPEDPEGKNMLVRRANLIPHYIRLPFQPKDEQYPVVWRVVRFVARVVGDMFDSWAPIELSEHVLDGKRRRGRRRKGGDDIFSTTLSPEKSGRSDAAAGGSSGWETAPSSSPSSKPTPAGSAPVAAAAMTPGYELDAHDDGILPDAQAPPAPVRAVARRKTPRRPRPSPDPEH